MIGVQSETAARDTGEGWADPDDLLSVAKADPYPVDALPGLLLAGPMRTVCDWRPLLDRTRIAVDDPAIVRPVAVALLRAKRVPIVEAIAALGREIAA